jgi:hypothetical protein
MIPRERLSSGRGDTSCHRLTASYSGPFKTLPDVDKNSFASALEAVAKTRDHLDVAPGVRDEDVRNLCSPTLTVDHRDLVVVVKYHDISIIAASPGLRRAMLASESARSGVINV